MAGDPVAAGRERRVLLEMLLDLAEDPLLNLIDHAHAIRVFALALHLLSYLLRPQIAIYLLLRASLVGSAYR